MGWSGSLTAVLESRMPLLTTLVADEDPQVSGWARDAAASFANDIERARQWEAEQARDRDQRFEH